MKDVTVVNLEPGPAAQAFVAGQNDAAMTYEPYLSTVRTNPQAGKIIATTLDYPMIMDTFGCTPKFLAENPKAAKALADSYFEAVEMIEKEPKKSFEIMGADVKQTGEQFEASQKYLRWQDKAANQKVLRRTACAVLARKRRTCCSRSASSSRFPISRSSPTRASSSSAAPPLIRSTPRISHPLPAPGRGLRVRGATRRVDDPWPGNSS